LNNRCGGRIHRQEWHLFFNVLADENHRVHTYVGTKVDAEQIKSNFGYCLHLYHDHPFKGFKKAVECIMEHHFSNHVNCGDWCCAKKWESQEKITKELKYQNKKKDARLYLQIRAIHEKLCIDKWLMDLWHDIYSNKCESLNGSITKFLPKKIFCRSMAICR
jgi:hypothetical protein